MPSLGSWQAKRRERSGIIAKLFEVTEKHIQALDGGAASEDPIGVGRTLYGWVASERRQGEDLEEARLLR